VAQTLPTLLLTRPAPQAEAFATLVRAGLGPVRGAVQPIVLAPLLRIRHLAADWTPGAEALIFTSAQAIEPFLKREEAAGRIAYCVGDQTAQAAGVAGFEARSASGTAEELIAMILAERPAARLLHPRGEHARGAVVRRLAEAGLMAEEVVVYAQEEVAPSEEAKALMASGKPVLAPLFSPRSAALFQRSFPETLTVHALCMSEMVASRLEPHAFERIDVIAQPDGVTMLGSVIRGLSPRRSD
jgi:uroporphyrinogen-III synthase